MKFETFGKLPKKQCSAFLAKQTPEFRAKFRQYTIKKLQDETDILLEGYKQL